MTKMLTKYVFTVNINEIINKIGLFCMNVKHSFIEISQRVTALLILISTSMQIYAQEETIVPVEVASVHFQQYTKALRISGLLENKSEQTLGFKVPGLVSRVYVDDGDYVKRGQLLASLDLEEIDAQVNKAKSVLKNAQRNLQRFESLQGQNALSMDQLQAAETRMDVAQSDLTVAQFNRRHAVIKASESGRILNRAIEPNELVQAGQPAFVFAAKKSGWVLRTGITDKDVVRMRLGDKAELNFDAYPNQQFIAVVSEIAGRADARTQTFGIELRLDNKKQQSHPLLAGFVGHGRIYPTHQDKLALIPLTALLSAEGKKGNVFIVDDQNKVHLSAIHMAFIEGDKMAVISGLKEGDRIVTQGVSYLSEGRSVTIKKDDQLKAHVNAQ